MSGDNAIAECKAQYLALKQNENELLQRKKEVDCSLKEVVDKIQELRLKCDHSELEPDEKSYCGETTCAICGKIFW